MLDFLGMNSSRGAALGKIHTVRASTEAGTQEIGAILSACPRIAAAWVFGSTARGEANRDSDLDVAVLLMGEATPEDRDALRTLAFELERFSPSGDVDIVVLGRQGPVFRHRVLREGKLVVDRSPELRHAFEARTIIEYLDWKPTHEIAMASTFQGLRSRFAKGNS